jgi:hypothetical protein
MRCSYFFLLSFFYVFYFLFISIFVGILLVFCLLVVGILLTMAVSNAILISPRSNLSQRERDFLFYLVIAVYTSSLFILTSLPSEAA